MQSHLPLHCFPLMTLLEKVKAVEEVFTSLDEEIRLFQGWSGLHCKTGCGKCCLKPDIEATALEFLPFAYYLYKNNTAEAWYEKLKYTEDSLCVLLDRSPLEGKGMCSEYTYRGLICRLFGFSARKNKYGKFDLVTCQTIKSEQADQFIQAASLIEKGSSNVPFMSHFHMRLMAIDGQLAGTHYPINKAIRMAIENVLSYYAYRSEEEIGY